MGSDVLGGQAQSLDQPRAQTSGAANLWVGIGGTRRQDFILNDLYADSGFVHLLIFKVPPLCRAPGVMAEKSLQIGIEPPDAAVPLYGKVRADVSAVHRICKVECVEMRAGSGAVMKDDPADRPRAWRQTASPQFM